MVSNKTTAFEKQTNGIINLSEEGQIITKEDIMNIMMESEENTKDVFLEEILFLEEDWRDVISENLNEIDQRYQDALWEFIKTERDYIKDLKVIVNHFMLVFSTLKSNGNLSKINEYDIFGNINDICRVNETFWMDYVNPALRKFRRDKIPLSACMLFNSACGQAFSFNDIFTFYEKFCLGLGGHVYLSFIKILNRVKPEPGSENESELRNNLKQWESWSEVVSQCGSSSLMQLLDKPRLRLTQYVMKLSVVEYNTTNQSELTILNSLITECTTFENHLNDKIRQQFLYKQLATCLEQLDDETTTETDFNKNELEFLLVKNFLKQPIRTAHFKESRFILDESKMKLITSKKREKVKTFLFSDVLLITKYNNTNKKYKIMSELYFLDKLYLLKSQESKNVVVLMYLDAFGLLASTFSFEIHVNEVDSWVALVKRAKLCYENSIAGKGSIYDFFRHGDSPLLFHYRKGKLLESFDDDGEQCADEIIFVDDFIQIDGSERGKLPTASYTGRRKRSSQNELTSSNELQETNDKSVSNTGTLQNGCVTPRRSRRSTTSLDQPSPQRPSSIICFRQTDGEQSTLIDYEENHPCFFLSFNKAAHKTTQTDIEHEDVF